MDEHHLQNDEVVFTILIAGFVFLALVAFIIVFILFYQKRRSAYIHELNAVKAKFQETLLRSQLEIKEQTLLHISRELHDNLGQIASLIKINLNTLNLNETDNAGKKIGETKELVRQLISDLKSLSISLNSDRVVQSGIVGSIETEIERLNKTGEFQAELRIHGQVAPLGANTTIILFRMVQEILNNTVKHSAAKRITLTFYSTENLLTLVCADDGIGFDLEEKKGSGGSGLLNLQNRAKQIDARFSISSSPQTGTTIMIELPINAAH